MYKTNQTKIASLDFNADEIEIDRPFEDYLISTEPQVFLVRYKGKPAMALYDDINQVIYVFDVVPKE